MFHDLFDLLDHGFLSGTAIHPFWLRTVAVACDFQLLAGYTDGLSLVAFLASEPAGPAALLGSERAIHDDGLLAVALG